MYDFELLFLNMKKLIVSSIFLYFFITSPSWASCIWGNCSNGQGAFIYDNGDKYIGYYKDDLANGLGTYTFVNGHEYIGEFKDDLFNGQGTQTYANGDKYVGEWKAGERNGQGTYTFVNGHEYIGEFKDDLFNGQGTFTFANGEKYVGEFKDDVRHGQGTSTWDSGQKYVGEWKNDLFNGQGTFTHPEGSLIKGNWINGDCVGCKIIAAKKTDDVKNEVSSSKLNSISSDGVYTYYSDNSCTDGGISGKCVTKSALNNVCNKIGTRIASNYFHSPCNGPWYDNEINKLCENNGINAISSNKTALINNKCVFEFSATGVVNGNSISRNYTCDVSSVYVENGEIHTLSTSRNSCQ